MLQEVVPQQVLQEVVPWLILVLMGQHHVALRRRRGHACHGEWQACQLFCTGCTDFGMAVASQTDATVAVSQNVQSISGREHHDRLQGCVNAGLAWHWG